MTTDPQESKADLSAELKDGDERLDWDPEPPMEPPPDDGTEEDYPAPGG